jgi:hypothetical protein
VTSLALLLTLAAVMLLVAGLRGGSTLLLVGSIAASLLAAVGLVVRARATPGQPADTADAGRRGAQRPDPRRERRQGGDLAGDAGEDPVL